MDTPAYRLLENGAAALRPFLTDEGELNDPVFLEPTQYGTAYYAYVNAVLASLTADAVREWHAAASRTGLLATLRHLLDPSDPRPPVADYSNAIASPGFRNLRDFMWPPVLRSLRILEDLGRSDLDEIRELVREVRVPDAFSERPPVNWAAVWILGEWMRIQQGLSPYTRADIDTWLAPFFAEDPDVDHGFYRELREATNVAIDWSSPIDLEAGFYREPGVPNSYDLWCRVHLLELLVEGYDGRYRGELETLLRTGVRRSLGVQLSTGSLASAYRSTAHLWNLTGQSWYFYHAARLLRGQDAQLSDESAAAAVRAFRAAQLCVRPTGDLSPVENVFPASWRVGYEVYTMEAHYVGLPLGYLATAVHDGFSGDAELARSRTVRTHLELDPVNRFLAHGFDWSVHVNLAPFDGYDSLGIADVTLGPGRRLRFGGQTHYGRADAPPDAHKLSNQIPFTLGLALRADDRSLRPVSAMKPTGGRWARETEGGFVAGAELDGMPYSIEVSVCGDTVRIVEAAGEGRRALLVPYLRDRGDGLTTVLERTAGGITLRSGAEIVRVTSHEPVERIVDLPFGYESRHGLVGLCRIDLTGSGPVHYDLERVQ